jgi:hypothetical protein
MILRVLSLVCWQDVNNSLPYKTVMLQNVVWASGGSCEHMAIELFIP